LQTQRSGFDLVAVSLDPLERRQDAADRLIALEWHAESAFVESDAIGRIECLLREIAGRERRLALPLVLALDRENRLVAASQGVYALGDLVRDAAHAARPEAEWRELAKVLPGRWLGGAPLADLLGLAHAFRAAGFEDGASTYELALAGRAEASGANALVAQGVARLEAQQFERAAELLTRAWRAEPQHFEAAAALGYSLQARNRFDEAADVYRRALVLRPNDAATLYNDATALWFAGDAAGAEATLFELEGVDPRAAKELAERLGL
jgi:tetratricopeptide (TPR) repeat protein